MPLISIPSSNFPNFILKFGFVSEFPKLNRRIASDAGADRTAPVRGPLVELPQFHPHGRLWQSLPAHDFPNYFVVDLETWKPEAPDFRLGRMVTMADPIKEGSLAIGGDGSDFGPSDSNCPLTSRPPCACGCTCRARSGKRFGSGRPQGTATDINRGAAEIVKLGANRSRAK